MEEGKATLSGIPILVIRLAAVRWKSRPTKFGFTSIAIWDDWIAGMGEKRPDDRVLFAMKTTGDISNEGDCVSIASSSNNG